MRRSPHTTSYADCVAFIEKAHEQARRNLSAARERGTHYLDSLVKDVETSRVLVRMLRKGMPGRQIDMLALFHETQK